MGFSERKKLDELSHLHSDFKLESGYTVLMQMKQRDNKHTTANPLILSSHIKFEII
jgi:hypothetical protein